MTFRFGVFQFDDASGELWRDGVRIRLEPQPARALTLLLSRPGEVVTREAMRQHLWGGDTHVDFDRGLAYCLGQVRAALGDSGENPRFVQTLPRRGFRFIAPVEGTGNRAPGPGSREPGTGSREPGVGRREPRAGSREPGAGNREPGTGPPPLSGDRAEPRRGPAEAAALQAANAEIREPGEPIREPVPARRSATGWVAAAAVLILLTGAVGWAAWSRLSAERPIVAVTVFDNETGLPQYDRLAAGAADVMVDALTALGPDRIGVIGNAASVRQPRGARDPRTIRRETGAGYLVIGQVQNDDGGVRMLTHLIRLSDETHLWVTRVVRAPGALEGIEAASAERLAEAVRLHVIEQRPDAPRFTR